MTGFPVDYYQGRGNYKGSAFQDTISFAAVPQKGYSIFSEFKLFQQKLSLFGRCDRFRRDFFQGEEITQRTITGVAFHFIKNCKLLVDYDHLDYQNEDEKDLSMLEMAIELQY